MTIQQCKYAIATAECGTFREAANHLFLAQSSLSASIKELEKELGIIIFERSKKGIQITIEGAEFLEYAKQIVAQADIIENRYHKRIPNRNRFTVSSQHYDFASEAFARLVRENVESEYDYRFRETKTYEVIDNVKSMDSEIGILYVNDFNEKVMYQTFALNHLEFHPLIELKPYIFLNKKHPLAKRKIVLIDELKMFPNITFEQNKDSSIQFAEEVYYFTGSKMQIKVNDRGTLLNLLVETDGYTIGSGVIASNVQNKELTSVPIKVDKVYTVGWISHNERKLSKAGKRYINILTSIIDKS